MKIQTNYFFSILLFGIIFFTQCEKEEFGGLPVDGDGNVYDTVVIGTQVWMAENLKTTRYNDGSNITHLDDNNKWKDRRNIGGYCFYDNDPVNKDIYGALYNIAAIKVETLCPKGWHVPSFDEWTTLINYLGGDEEYVSLKLMEQGDVHWTIGSEGNNESGFTALPAGARNRSGSFSFIGEQARFWAYSPSNNNSVYCVTISSSYLNIQNINYDGVGYSVRCVKDD